MIRNRLLLLLAIGILFGVFVTAVPASAQNYTPSGVCGLGQYWLIHDNQWDGVLIRQGNNSATFKGFGAMWMQPDGTATFNISIDGDAVTMDRVDDPNIFGTTSCHYEGTVRPDGVSVVGTTTCQVQGVTSPALSWTAHIACDVPEITWNDTAFWHRAAKGQQFTFMCPYDGFRAPVWGTDIYIEGSSICAAAVHAGAITLENGGLVTIEILPGELSYPGSTRNGITSDTFPTPGQFNTSFRVLGGQTSLQQPTVIPGLVSIDPRIVGAWVSDDGYELDFDSSGTAVLVGADPPLTWHITAVNGNTVSGYAVAELASGDTTQTCDREQYGSRLWADFVFTFDDQYTSFGTTFTLCGQFDSELGIMHRKGGAQLTVTSTPAATAAPRWDNFVGKWSTSFGDVKIGSDGVATYVDADTNTTAHIYFQQEDSHTISGYWVEASSGANCGVEREGSNYWGRIRWTFDENFTSFDGVWGYCDTELTGGWGGRRIQ